MENTAEHIGRLREQIEYHNDLYYNQDRPDIEDSQYDEMTQELKRLENEYPEYASKESPTKKVGGKASGNRESVEHRVPMLSLKDVFSIDDVLKFTNAMPDEEYCVEPKIDGLSISLEYKDGKFMRGSTRGDGLSGEDVTENLMMIDDIPKRIYHKKPLTVRGEVYMSFASFQKANEYQELIGEDPFANARNCAAGTLRQLRPSVVKERGLNTFVFNVQRGLEGLTHHQQLSALKELGFIPVESTVTGSEGVLQVIDSIREMRSSLPYGIDGAAVKLNDIKLREKLGSTSNTPRWAVAYKYPAERKETKVLDIICQVGRTGRITPVAILEPTPIAGTTVTRATLHNQDQINALGIGIGSTCFLEKGGDIIPKIISVIPEKSDPGTVPYVISDVCPECGEKAERDGADLRCQNLSCPAQKARSLIFFAAKKCMDIDGLGPVTVAALVDAGYINNPSDYYTLHEVRNELIEKNIIGKDKTVDNLLAAIEGSKNRPLPNIIKSLGWKNVGGSVGEVLAKKYSSMTAIMNLTEDDFEELKSLPGFGEIIARSVIAMTTSHNMKEVVFALGEEGVNMGYSSASEASTALSGLSFVITGTLPTMKRDEAEKLVKANGGAVSGSVSKKTSYLVAGENAGSKLDKANSLGIPVISESEFVKMLTTELN